MTRCSASAAIVPAVFALLALPITVAGTYTCGSSSDGKGGLAWCVSTTENWFSPTPDDKLTVAGFDPIVYEMPDPSPAGPYTQHTISAPAGAELGDITFTSTNTFSTVSHQYPVPGCPNSAPSWTYGAYAAHGNAATIFEMDGSAGPDAPVTLDLPVHTGAFDTMLDYYGNGLLRVTVTVVKEDATEVDIDVTFTETMLDAVACSGYLAMWHKKGGQIRRVSFAPASNATIIIGMLVRAAYQRND